MFEEEMTAEDQFEEICEDDLEPSDGDFSDSDYEGGADMDDAVIVSTRLVQDSKGDIKWMQYVSIDPWRGWWIDEPQQ